MVLLTILLNQNKIDFIFFLYKINIFTTTMTIFYITNDEEEYCMGVAHFIEFTKNFDKDDIWNFYNSQGTDREGCFLYTIKILSREPEENEQPAPLLEKRPKFKFINNYPVEIIDDKDNELDEDIVRNFNDYESEDEE
jgi:hypothetical protein